MYELDAGKWLNTELWGELHSPKKDMVKSYSQYLRMWSDLETQCLQKKSSENDVIWEALTQYEWWPSKKEKSGNKHTLRKGIAKRSREKKAIWLEGCIYNPSNAKEHWKLEEARNDCLLEPSEKVWPLTPWSQTCSLQKCEAMFLLFKPSSF